MLSFIIVTYNGDLEIIERKVSILIWYEEQFLLFKLQYGLTLQSIKGKMTVYNVEYRRLVANIFDSNLEYCMEFF